MIGCMPREFRPPTDEQRCTATVVHGPRAGQRCPKYRVRGTNVCMQHGASAPQVRAAAARRVADAKAVELASKIEIEVPRFASAGEVGSYLLGEVHKRTAQFGVLVDRLESATYTDRAGQERIRAVLAEQRRWLDSMTKVLAVAVAAKSDEPEGPNPVEMFSMTVGLFREDVDSALADVGIYGEQHEAILARLAERAKLRLSRDEAMIVDQIRIMAGAR